MRSPLSWFRALPLRTRWLLTIVVYAAVIAAIVIVVRDDGGGSEGSGGSAHAEAAANAQANRVGRVAIAQDEAPHSARLAPGVPLRVALERAISADVRRRVVHGELTGPLQGVSCGAPAPAVAGRRQLSCTARSAGLNYPFVGVADERTEELTWCKIDPPAQPGAPLEVPVSPRCRA
ncbi:MAG TPA: hypothetical protein VMD79_10260 [Solirubrobacteraceae bacterium]|nr:hypothetical protein [Solirubrobacteraceae bacterium]